MKVFEGNVQLTLIIPVRNQTQLLQQCLSGVAKQSVSPKDYEVLICDDGSTEEIRTVVERFRGIFHFRFLHQEHKGPAAARNLGILECNSPIILFLDSDVQPDKNIVSKLLAALNQNREWMGAEARIESNGETEGPLWDGPSCQNGGVYHTAAIAYRRDAIIKVGGFDESFKLPACEDADLAVQVLKLGPIGFVPEAVAKHPRRRITLKTHWRWRKFWKYEMFLAKRYGFLAFPGNPAERFPRLRVALAAVITLPAGRFIEGVKYVGTKPSDGLLACLYALFDVFCGFCALPSIFFARVRLRRNYLSQEE